MTNDAIEIDGHVVLCALEGCTRPRQSGRRYWCSMHSSRLYRTGSVGQVEATRVMGTAAERLAAYTVTMPSGCIEWTGSRDKLGYGHMAFNGRPALVHRVNYELFVGPIPDGLVLDHLCRNPPCVNPEHLEAVTQGENINRGKSHVALNRFKTHCPHGHPYSGDNLISRRVGSRACRTCKHATDSRYVR